MTVKYTMKPGVTTIFVDLGGIFVHPSVDHHLTTGESTVSLRRMMTSSIWMAYETGKISDHECMAQLAARYGCQADELTELIQKLRVTTDYDHDMASVFREIKEASSVKIVLVSNISEADYLALRQAWGNEFWSIFDHIFTSAMLGVRKPSLRFYRHVLRATRAIPRETFFIDDTPENVLAAMSMGIRGTFCTEGLYQRLTNAIGDPVERGLAFLKQNAGQFHSTTEDGTAIEENFASLLILDVMSDLNLVDLKRPSRLWNFFRGKPKYTCATYPADLDTTSMGLATMAYDETTVHSILDEMLDYVDEDGLVQAYFDKSRPRVDPVVAINVLTLFYMYDRGYELPETLDWIHNILLNRAYINGTRYYPSPESFLYYLTRLLRKSKDQTLREKLEVPLRARIVERIGTDGDAACLGMRLLACNYLGIENYPDRERLASMQWEDGGWEPSCMYQIPCANKKLGNRGTSTAFAVRALQGWPGKDYSLLEATNGKL